MAAKPKTAVYVGILAIVIALIASVSLYRYLKGQEEELKKAVATEKIIIAKRDISIGSTIEKAQTDSIDWPLKVSSAGLLLSGSLPANRLLKPSLFQEADSQGF
jgi:Flp pilus assembly protein CpaB